GSPEYQSGEYTERADSAERDAPGSNVGEIASHEAARHAAETRSADVKSHRQADRLVIHLFAQVGHGNCRQSTEGDAFQRADHQESPPAGHKRAYHGQYRSSEKR